LCVEQNPGFIITVTAHVENLGDRGLSVKYDKKLHWGVLCCVLSHGVEVYVASVFKNNFACPDF